MLSETLKTGRPVDSTAHFGDAVVFYPVVPVSLTLTSHSVIRLSGYPVVKMVSWERLMKSDIWRRLFASLGKHRFEDFS